MFGLPLLDRAAMREQARQALAQFDFAPDPDTRVDRLSFAERQLVAIAKALRKRCRLLILDEPTAALETREIERLFAVLARMKARAPRSSMSRTGSTRWWRWPTAAPCCATAGLRRRVGAARSRSAIWCRP